MESSILKQITRFLQEQKKHKRWAVVFVCLAVIVGFGTVTALKMMGQAMTHKERRLVCQLQVHQHEEGCYDAEQNVVCGYADYVVHKHNDDCYMEDGTLACALPELEVHEHTEECWSEEQTVVCGLEESIGHEHTEECYTQQTGEVQCGLEEHQHTEECSDEEGNLVCVLEEHEHAEECYPVESVLTCTVPEGEGAHTHAETCYEVQRTLVCEKPEVRLHTHADECYEIIDPEQEYSEENRRLICEQLQVEEHVHTEDGGCLEVIEVTAVGEPVEDTPAEEPEIFTTDLDGEDADAEAEDGTGEEDADGEDAEAEGEDIADDVDENAEEDKTYQIVKTYTGDGYTVTAEYNGDADIPEEAELIAEQITVDSDEEHYAKREAEYRKSTGDKNAVMKALFKVGFYVDGEEVEPKTAVKLTIQLFDENGLPEGTPITVVHFAEKGTEVLDGSEAESGSTSFEMESFSDVAIGFKKADAKKASVKISDSFLYKDEAFQITFHVEGIAKLEETEDGENPEEDESVEEEGSDMSESEGSEESLEEGSDVSGDISDGEMSGEDETDSEDMMTLPSVEGAGSEEAGSDAEDEASGETQEDNGANGLEFKVVPLEKGTREYEAAVAHANSMNDGSELLLVRVLSYKMYYNGKKLSLKDCEVTADIGPAEELSNKVEASVPEAIEYLREEGDINEEEGEQEDSALNEMQTEFVIRALQTTKKSQAKELDSIYLSQDNSAGTMKIKLQGDTAVVYVSSQANPHFTVKYFANLKVMSEERKAGLDALNIIDTSKKPDGTEGPALPKNGITPYVKNILVDESGNIQYKEELVEVYKSREFDYITAPSLMYFNALVENTESYELKKVKVTHADGTQEEYDYNESLHFTNRKKTAEGKKYVLIDEGAQIDLIYDIKDSTWDSEATFYDYDISDGSIYSKNDLNSKKITDRTKEATKDNPWYMYTKQQGINNPQNYKGGGAKLAFGNKNGFTTLAEEKVGNNYINQANGASAGNGYLLCAFGLVSGLDEKGNIIYANGVRAPKLFNEGEAIGKSVYNDHNLNFIRSGDTYTLTSVEGTETKNLHQLGYKRLSWNKELWLWSNEFWPMDNVESAGTNGHDAVFGKEVEPNKNKYYFNDTESGFVQESDHRYDHNPYFGMTYTVKFDLAKDYIGPLEYYFFGDDDMWVFLDGKLVCDIGGVHNSVGEYVDLWDYLDKDGNMNHKHDENCYDGKGKLICSEEHTLSFFYTERGASGSTCWMQFTLPSVSSMTPEQVTGQVTNSLLVGKTVENADLDQQYEFEIHFTKNDEDLPDDYSYTKYKKIRKKDENGKPIIDENGKPVYEQKVDGDGKPMVDEDGNPIYITEVVAKDILISDGGTFTLGDGEYIIVNYLPAGTKYTITEKDKSNEYDININGEEENSGTINGDMGNVDSTVEYVNKYHVYELPKTGGPGPIIYTMAGVLVIIFGAGFMYRKKVRERRV